MVDNLSLDQRRRNMANIKSRHTQPELLVRRIIHSLGFRFRLHSKFLPGKPDIVLPRHHKIILVHGCFWHRHDCRRGNVTPQTNYEYWQNKRDRTVQRDADNYSRYLADGWSVLTVWECEIHAILILRQRLKEFLVGEV